MTSTSFVLWSSALSFGAPLVFAVYELIGLRRRGGSGDDGRGPDAPKPLPDCLQPHVLLSPKRIRELHDA